MKALPLLFSLVENKHTLSIILYRKVTLVNLSGSGAMIDLTLDIFSDAFRNESANLFFVPDTVYARVAISTFGVPNTFYPQVIFIALD